jgi:HNH endonuclease
VNPPFEEGITEMSLLSSTTVEHERKVAAWQKAQIVPGYDSNVHRKDSYGWWIAWIEYGKQSEYGWEIDHIVPLSRGGSDAEINLQALHWKSNRSKSDKFR